MEVSRNIQMLQNVDAEDIKKFNAFAKDWWDLKGSQHGLHDMNNVRVPWVRDGLIDTKVLSESVRDKPNALEGAVILDVGCGGGILSEALGRLGATVVGLDAAVKLIELAQHHLEPQKEIRDRVSYVCETIEEHCEKNPEKYDAVVASEVIEHILDKESFLEACVKALKPGGSIFISTPNRTFVSWFCSKLMGEYVLRVIEQGTHDFNLFIKPKNVSKILEKFDCKTVSVKGMRYDLHRRQNKWQFQDYLGFSYALQAVKEKK